MSVRMTTMGLPGVTPRISGIGDDGVDLAALAALPQITDRIPSPPPSEEDLGSQAMDDEPDLPTWLRGMETAEVSAVLLADGWHRVATLAAAQENSLSLDAYDGVSFVDGESGRLINAPIQGLLAIEFDL